MAQAKTQDGSDTNEFAGFDHHAKGARVGAECVWARMRDTPGLAHSDLYGGFYVVSRYEDLSQALLDPLTYSSAAGLTIPDPSVRSAHIPAEIDPPLHSDYRALLSRFLTREKVKGLEASFRTLAVNLLDGLEGRTRIDFFKDFARPLPVHVSLSLVGLPMEDADKLEAWVNALHEEIATGVKTGAAQKLTDYVEAALVRLAPSARDPHADILSSIVLGVVDGRRTTLEEQVSIVRLFLIGGFDTTAYALSTAMWWLAQHPEQVKALREDPALIESAVDEFVRFSSSASYLRRTVTRDAELGGICLHKGDRLLLAFGAANRDPRKFDHAEEVVLDRSPNRHAGFGFGIHRCIGTYVAWVEMRVAFEEILKRYKGFSLDPAGEVVWSSGGNQGVSALPLILEPA